MWGEKYGRTSWVPWTDPGLCRVPLIKGVRGSMKRYLWILTATALAVSLPIFVSGCGRGRPDGVKVAARIRASREALRAYHARVEVVTAGEGTTTEISLEQWVKQPNLYRVEADLPGRGKRISVSDGATVWVWDEGDNRVAVTDLRNGTTPSADNYLLVELLDTLLGRFTMEVTGQEKVGGRECYVLKLSPKPEGDPTTLILPESVRWWVDGRWWLPLRMELTGRGTTTTITYQDLQLNPRLEDRLFNFSIPPGARVVRGGFSPELLPVEEARGQVGFKVLTPRYLPEGVRLKGARLVEVGETILVLEYEVAGEGGRLQITQSRAQPDPAPFPGAQRIAVGEFEGHLYVGDSYLGDNLVVLRWTREGTSIVLSGTFDRGTMLKIGESMQ